MATQTTIRLVDDLDGTEADETVEFALGKAAYLIDLSEDNAAKLRGALAEFTAAARRIGGTTTRRRRSTRQLVAPAPQPTATPAPQGNGTAPGPAASNGAAATTKTIRQWAQANGYDIGDRGRIRRDILDAYAASPR